MQEDKRSALLIFCMMREMIVTRKPQNSKQEIVNIKTMTLQGMEAQFVEVQVEVSNGFPRLGNSRASSY